MDLDLTRYFAEYEALVAQVDAVFQKVTETFSSEVKCKHGCSDCCHALFDITLVEALYLNSKFHGLDEARRSAILLEADKADRKAYRIKKKASRDAESVEHAEILFKAAQERVRCPLLDEQDACSLYTSRPVTCRMYGIPLEIGGKSHTCGLSGFEPGQPYPAVKVEKIQDRLLAISNQILDDMGSSYAEFRLMHIPVSSALITVFSDEFFGLGADADDAEESTSTGEHGAEISR